jgi:hypothetical protein
MPDSSRKFRFVAGSNRGGAVAIAGVAGFSDGPFVVDVAVPLALATDPGELASVFETSRSRSWRVAGAASLRLLATAVGRVPTATRGVGTWAGISRVSLMLRAAADGRGFLRTAGDSLSRASPSWDTGFVATGLMANGRGMLLWPATEVADVLPFVVWPSTSDRETLARRVSPIRRGKSFATPT